jgi:hypothetical protein
VPPFFARETRSGGTAGATDHLTVPGSYLERSIHRSRTASGGGVSERPRFGQPEEKRMSERLVTMQLADSRNSVGINPRHVARVEYHTDYASTLVQVSYSGVSSPAHTRVAYSVDKAIRILNGETP